MIYVFELSEMVVALRATTHLLACWQLMYGSSQEKDSETDNPQLKLVLSSHPICVSLERLSSVVCLLN